MCSATVRFRHTYVLTLEPYAQDMPHEVILEDFSLLGLRAEVLEEYSREGEIVVKVENVELPELAKIVRNLDYVSHMFELVYVTYDRDIENIAKLCREVLEEVIRRFPVSTFKVLTKRIDKKYPLTSIDVCRYVGAKLVDLCRVKLEEPDCCIYVEIRSDVVLIGYSLRDYLSKTRECTPDDLIRRVFAVIDNPTTLYEVMDLVQLARALGLELRLLDRGSVQDLVKKACEKLGLSQVPENVKVCRSAEECLADASFVLVLTQYARLGESFLAEIAGPILSRGHRICLVLGNEYEDPGLDLRRRAHYEIRLGPCTGQAMRTTTALAYALGVIMTSWRRTAHICA